MKNLFVLLFLMVSLTICAQNSDYFLVTSKGQNLRNSEGSDFKVLATLQQNDLVKLIKKNDKGFWIVEFNGVQGFFPAKFLKKRSLEGWTVTKYETGDIPTCDKVSPQHDYTMENHLKITVNSDADIVLKLMKKQKDSDVCVRTVYIESYDFMVLKHIPQGKYYLKIAYGNDWRQKKIGAICQGIFAENAHFEMGKQQLNFNLIELGNQVQTPSYALTLGTKVNDGSESSFISTPISQKEFDN